MDFVRSSAETACERLRNRSLSLVGINGLDSILNGSHDVEVAVVLHNGIVAVGGCQDAAGRAVVGTAGVLLLVDSVADGWCRRGGPVEGDVMDAAGMTHEDEAKEKGRHKAVFSSC